MTVKQIAHEDLTVIIVPVLNDNYSYIVAKGSEAIGIDPPDAKAVMSVCQQQALSVTGLLCTHKHSDHTAGLAHLKEVYHCSVYGPVGEDIPAITNFLEEDTEFWILDELVEVIHTPGHTKIHHSYYFPRPGWLFCGDSLFMGGCGRLFECAPEIMWSTLRRIMELPDDTLVFCGHEYTEENYRFAVKMDPGWEPTCDKYSEVKKLRRQGLPTVPGVLGAEKRTNIFLRSVSQDLKSTLNMSGENAETVFARLRAMKDTF